MNKISENLNEVSSDGGNTSSIAKSIRSRKWFITLNNPKNLDKEKILTYITKFSKIKYAYCDEIGKENGVPHFHVYINAEHQISFDSIKNLLPKANIQKALGNDVQNLNYIKKDGDYFTNIEEPKNWKDIILNKEYSNVIWKTWQAEILNLLKTRPDKRKIYWYYDIKGNTGKSFLFKYIVCTHDIIICDGKKDNVLNQVRTALENKQPINIIILDVPRCNKDYINFGLVEQLKNGCIYSGKYEGGVCVYEIPHVIIFTNHKPEIEELKNWSPDRWCIKQIYSDSESSTDHEDHDHNYFKFLQKNEESDWLNRL